MLFEKHRCLLWESHGTKLCRKNEEAYKLDAIYNYQYALEA
jgi:hypothetical protein